MLVDAAPPRDVPSRRSRGGSHGGSALRGARALAGAFAALLALTFGLLVLGALVRAHGAGLACPDWPLCFGELVPRMDLRVAFEWSHRAVAGSVALVFATLAVLTWRRTSPGDGLRRGLVLAALLLVVQIGLGALTVWKLLASWTVTSHLVTGNAFTATLAWLALELSDRARAAPARPRPPVRARRALGAAALLLAAQMVLGGLVSSRYAGFACPDWPTCNAGVWFPSWEGAVGLHLLHRTTGYLLLGALVVLAGLSRGAGRFGALCAAAAGLAVLQVAVGAANVLLGIPVEVTGLHSALAAALVLVATAAAREAWGG